MEKFKRQGWLTHYLEKEAMYDKLDEIVEWINKNKKNTIVTVVNGIVMKEIDRLIVDNITGKIKDIVREQIGERL